MLLLALRYVYAITIYGVSMWVEEVRSPSAMDANKWGSEEATRGVGGRGCVDSCTMIL